MDVRPSPPQKTISVVNIINSKNNSVSDEVTSSVLNFIQELGLGSGGDLPPFIALSKLEPGRIFTVQKILRRVQGEDNAPYSGIHLYLDSNRFRTGLPSK